MSTRLLSLLSALICAAAIVPAYAFTENDIRRVFSELDVDGDGKVTREEYNGQKIFVIYSNVPVDPYTATGGDIKFGETKMSRRAFDAADADRNGQLSATEITDAFKFENIDKNGKGYFTLDELSVFMNGISS